MSLTSYIPEAKGLCSQIARLFLWSDNHLIVEEKQIEKLQNIASEAKKQNKLLKASVMLLIAIIITQILLYNNFKNTATLQKENILLTLEQQYQGQLDPNKIQELLNTVHKLENNLKDNS